MHRDCRELSIFHKLRRIRQFKESLRRLAAGRHQALDASCAVDEETPDPGPGVAAASLQGSCKLWVGKDYCNFIFKDVVKVHAPFQDSVERARTPRMPWHDVAGCVWGAAARDIARHFIQRWNYIKAKKARRDPSLPYLLPKAYGPAHYALPRDV